VRPLAGQLRELAWGPDSSRAVLIDERRPSNGFTEQLHQHNDATTVALTLLRRESVRRRPSREAGRREKAQGTRAGHGPARRPVVSAIAAHGLELGLIPWYQTLQANIPSIAIAMGLGFSQYAKTLAVRFKQTSNE